VDYKQRIKQHYKGSDSSANISVLSLYVILHPGSVTEFTNYGDLNIEAPSLFLDHLDFHSRAENFRDVYLWLGFEWNKKHISSIRI
jgi:hypothetical protein